MKTPNGSSVTYEQMGMAALLPGMQHVLAILEGHINEMRDQIAALQGHPAKRGRGRPPMRHDDEQVAEVMKRGGNAQKKYWAKMTPEQRSAEMIRRQALWAKKIAVKEIKKKPAKPKIYDPAHPGNKAWLAKMSRLAKKRWASAPKGTNRLPPAAKHVNGAAA